MRCSFVFLALMCCLTGTSCSTGQVVDEPGDPVGQKSQSQVTPDLSGVTHMADLIRSTWEAQSPPCLGLETIRREVFEQIWTILGDIQQVDLWEAVPPYIALAGDANDLSLLFNFATRGVEGEISSFNKPTWQVHNGLSRALRAIGPLGARLAREGDPGAEELALSFLVECADPAFWRSSRVTWRRSNARNVELRSAHDCIASAGHLGSSSLARMVQRVDSLTPRLNQEEAGELRGAAAAAAEIHQWSRRSFDETLGRPMCRADL